MIFCGICVHIPGAHLLFFAWYRAGEMLLLKATLQHHVTLLGDA